MIHKDRILFIPSLRGGNGTGHLKRCLDWCSPEPLHIYRPSMDREDEAAQILSHPLFRDERRIVLHESLPEEPRSRWDLVILDNRSTSGLPPSLKGIPVIALDEAGEFREEASYTIDMLPGGRPGLSPNRRAPGFLPGPAQVREEGDIRRILVLFGGEDPAGLGGRFRKALEGRSDLSSKREWVIPSVPIGNLRDEIHRFDLVLCSFGLTAFEALAARVPVLLFNPSAYHDRLSREAGLEQLPGAWKREGKVLLSFVEEWLADPKRSERQDRLFSEYAAERLPFLSWICELNISRDSCPACGSSRRRAVERFENKSYFRCRDCSMIYMVQFRMKEDIYGTDYFFSDYKNQYGKTYLEDFESIAAMGRSRLGEIARRGKRSGRLLDIGCAYGPFLREARDAGFTACGLEVSSDAVDYIREQLEGIDARSGDLERVDPRTIFSEPFEVITLWYVIEHMQNLDKVLSDLGSMLLPGGLLCLSTPCGAGVSALKERAAFLRQSPEDHYTVWTRASARRVLRRCGFTRIRFRSTGHHPERFPKALRLLFPASLLGLASRLLGLGDTFEIYAEKKKG